jgi:hypothetical protein
MGGLDATSRVVVVSLSFQSSQNSLTLDDLELPTLDLVVKEAIERHGRYRMAAARGVMGVGGRGEVVLVEFVDRSADGLAFGLMVFRHFPLTRPWLPYHVQFLGNRDQGLPSSQKKTRQSRLWSRLPFRTVALRATSWDRCGCQLIVYLRQKKTSLPPSVFTPRPDNHHHHRSVRTVSCANVFRP